MSAHELRVAPLQDEEGAPGMLPYCPCGWIGHAERAQHNNGTVHPATDAYLTHLEGLR